MKTPDLPPRWARWLLTRLHPADTLEEVEGDLDELYAYWYGRAGKTQATVRYVLNVVSVLPPFVRRRKQAKQLYEQPSSLHPDMIRNYFKIAWRGFSASKGYSAINIGGLAVALGVGMLLVWWVKAELSVDRFHAKADRIYRVNTGLGSGTSQQVTGNSAAPVGTYAKREVPGVEDAVRVADNHDASALNIDSHAFTEHKSVYVDPAFFTLFNFEWVAGDPKHPFRDSQSVVITESAARRFFGEADPMGKVIYSVLQKTNYVVSGIIRNVADPSNFQQNLFFPFALLSREYGQSLETDWENHLVQTYLLVNPDVPSATIAGALTNLHRRHNSSDKSSFYQLQPLTNIHLYGPDGNATAMQEVQMMGLIALMLLSIGCINYVNLATARAIKRAKEVGVRKAVGAGRKHLIGQFVAESLLIFALSLVLSVGLIKGIEPFYRELTGQLLPFSLADPQVWVVLVSVLLFTLLLAGGYPALLMSSFEPIKVLQGRLGNQKKGSSFRKVLVVGQFILSTVLIVSTLIIGNQLRFIRERNLGYDRANVFAFWMGDMKPHYQGVKANLLRQPGVLGVSSANSNLVQIFNSTGDTDWDGKEANSQFTVSRMAIEEDFIPMFKLKLVLGQNFTGSKADSMHYILNETAVKKAGIRNPIGKRFKVGQTEGTILGVVADFHFASMRQPIEPAIFSYQPDNARRILVRTTGRETPAVLAATEQLWKTYNPELPFEYQFLDEQYNKLYQSEQRTGQLFNGFAGIAILISCLGLFGLATFTAEQRTKEIGVRKVMGATVGNIVALLSKDFLKLVLIAILMASPIAWWAMNRWLQDFAYKIDIEWWMFVLAGLLAVGVAMLTVSYQSIKAALMNPVKSLRSE